MAKKYHLTDKDRTTLRDQRRLIDTLLSAPRGSDRRRPGSNVWSRIIKTPSGGIDARLADVPGSAACELVKINTDDELEVITAADDITVWNIGPKLPGSEYMLAVLDPWSRWVAVPSRQTAHFKTGGGGIGARSDADTPTGATCTMYRFNGTDYVTFSPSITATVYNSSPEAVEADTYIIAIMVDGFWFAIFEPCLVV